MHDDEVFTDVELARRLIAEQFPQWADLQLRPVPSHGTDHDIYRVGADLVARLPRIGWADAQAIKEARWLPLLAPQLPLALPEPVALGRPTADYPFGWSICRWLPGDRVGDDLSDLDQAAADLAGFVRALRRVDTSQAPVRPPGGRGGPLTEHLDQVERSVRTLGDRVDGAAVRRSWQESLEAPAWPAPDRWIHGDLMPGNLLAVAGRLSAVIDFGGLNVGDPACDLQPAWHLFEGGSRERYLVELDTDVASRLRGRGWALYQSVSALAYYWDTNPPMIDQARRTLAAVLADS